MSFKTQDTGTSAGPATKMLGDLWNGGSHDLFTIPFRNLHTKNQPQNLNDVFQILRHRQSHIKCKKLLCNLWNSGFSILLTYPVRDSHMLPQSHCLNDSFQNLKPQHRSSMLGDPCSFLRRPSRHSASKPDALAHRAPVQEL